MNLSLKIQEECHNGECVIRAAGDLIITNANHLQETIDQILLKGVTTLRLDLTQIQYIDSFGIGVIVKAKAEIDKRKGHLTVQVSPVLKNLFAKCHLDDYIDLEIPPEE